MSNTVIPSADAHCDFLYYMYNRDYSFASPRSQQAVSLEAMRKGGAALQLFAAWIDIGARMSPLQQCLSLIDTYNKLLDENAELVRFTKDYTPSCGKIACVLTVEGGEALEGREENVRIFHSLGVRAMTLTWNDSNELASASMSRRDKGLTVLGRAVVREMERVGIAVDVAHLSDCGIDAVLDETNAPIFSSHTNARSVFLHKRSMCDRHIKEIARRGGVIGVNYFSPQLVRSGRASIFDVADHIEHIAGVGGIASVVLGSDFDGMGSQSYPLGLESWADVPKLIQALEKRGFTDEQIHMIAYDNLANYIRRFI